MTQLVLVIWASLLFSELTAQPMVPALGNLTCYQCFKVSQPTQCRPSRCGPGERVCISNELYIQRGVQVGTQISKRCAGHCLNSNSLYEWSPTTGTQNTIIRSCCSKHLCNTAPVASGGLWALLGRFLLPVGLGLLCTLLP
uniref:Lymphocyte antigen 6 complex, locus L n=1 Tax=Jaculus jaculus TaxID=51337 RepID=A0A8C5LL36_JACJA